MTAPTVRGFGTPSNQTDMAPAKAVTAPTRAAGDLLIAIAVSDTTTTAISWGATYTAGDEEAGSAGRISWAWRIATNDASDDTTFAATNNNDGSAVILAIQAGTHGVTQTSDIVHPAAAQNTTGNADPPASGTVAAKDWLAVAIAGVDLTATGSTISAAPTNYTTGALLTKSASSTSSVALGVGYRALTNATAEDPGAFTNTSGAWVAKTLLIPPTIPPQSFTVAQATIDTAGNALTIAGEAAWSTFSHAPSTSTSITVTGLTNATTYEFRVAAVNAAGTGPFSTTDTATPAAGMQQFTVARATLDTAGAAVAFTGTGTATFTLAAATVDTAGHVIALTLPSSTLHPASISGRKILDQNGDVYLLRSMSSWGMAENLSNADITTALEGLAGLGFNSVTVIMDGSMYHGTDWNRFQNAASQNFWTGTPYQSSLGAAWATTDWIVAEADRLGMVVSLSLFGGYGAGEGARDWWTDATDAQMYDAGVAVATRYLAAANIVWHLEFDGTDTPTDPAGQRALAFFHGVNDTEGATTRPARWMEPGQPSTTDSQGWLGTGYAAMSVNCLYDYGSDSTGIVESCYAEAVAPIGDAEPNYDGKTGITGWQIRWRSYAVFLEGGSVINWGQEAWWPFGKTGLYNAESLTWQQVLTHSHTLEASYLWALLDDFVADTTWAPTAMVTAGESTNGKAAAGASDTAAVIYFPEARTGVTLNTTLFPGTDNVRLRWYDPTAGTYSTISASEAQNASRSITYNAGTHGDGETDWVLVVDVLTAAPQSFTVAQAVVVVTGHAATVSGSGTVALTVARATVDTAGAAVAFAPSSAVTFTLARATVDTAGNPVSFATGGVSFTVAPATLDTAGHAPSYAATGAAPFTVARATLDTAGAAPSFAPSSSVTFTVARATVDTAGAPLGISGSGSVTFTVARATIRLTGHPPASFTTGGVSFALARATVDTAGHAPTFAPAGAAPFTVGHATVDLVGHAPTLEQAGAIPFTVAPATVDLAGHAPTFTGAGQVTFTVAPATLDLSGRPVTVMTPQLFALAAAVLHFAGRELWIAYRTREAAMATTWAWRTPAVDVEWRSPSVTIVASTEQNGP